MILILEDDVERVAKFRAAVTSVTGDLAVRFWRSAHEMCADLPDCLHEAAVISLDHDLIRAPGDERDPGCGYDVAQLLEKLIPCCPIIIHTSNVERGTWMEGALSLSGWRYMRVAPFGDDWIANDWAAALKELLGR